VRQKFTLAVAINRVDDLCNPLGGRIAARNLDLFRRVQQVL